MQCPVRTLKIFIIRVFLIFTETQVLKALPQVKQNRAESKAARKLLLAPPTIEPSLLLLPVKSYLANRQNICYSFFIIVVHSALLNDDARKEGHWS